MSLLEAKDVFPNGKLNLSEEVCKELRQLSTIVLNSHYRFVNSSDREDLIEEGIKKALELLMKGDFTPTRSTLKNYLYTGIRNEIGNYLYRNKKEIISEEFYVGKEDDFLYSFIKIPFKQICFWCKIFERRNGDCVGAVCKSLKDLGFEVEGEKKIDKVLSEINTEKRLVKKIVCLIIWENRDSYH